MGLSPIKNVFSNVAIVSLHYCIYFFPPEYCVSKAMTYTTVKTIIAVYVQAILSLTILISGKKKKKKVQK